MRFFSTIVLFLLLTPFFATAAAPISNEARNAATQLESAGALGKGQTDESLSRPVSRAEFLKMLLTAAGFRAPVRISLVPLPCTDTPNNTAWYRHFLAEAMRIGLMPREQMECHPDENLTRGEALQMALFVYGIPTPRIAEGKTPYRDVPDGSDAMVQKTVELRLMEPQTNSIFGLRQALSRADAALLISRTAAAAGATAASSAAPIRSSESRFGMLDEVSNQLKGQFYHAEQLNDEKMLYGAIEGLVESAGDRYTVFMRPEQATGFTDDLKGEIEGIGAYIGKEKERVIIIAPIRGAPADLAGLKPNDTILKVDGISILGLSLAETVAKIKGPKGSTVRLSIDRDGQSMEISIVRDKVKIESVKYALQNGVAVITLAQFGAQSVSEIDTAMMRASTENASAIILDLRGNPGGFLNAAITILEMFLPQGTDIVKVKYPNITIGERNLSTPKYPQIPLAVLIDDLSASASEIVAGTLKDFGRAKIVGKKSFGKGTVQQLSYFGDGSSLKVTVAEWLTGKGNSINGAGVSPEIEAVDDKTTVTDEALDAAMRALGH